MARRRARESPDPIDLEVGARLSARRRELGLSLRAVGDALEISAVQLGKYERGFDRISASRLVRAAAAMGTTVSDLVGAPSPAPLEPFVIAELASRDAAELLSAFVAIEHPALQLALVNVVRRTALAASRRVEPRASSPFRGSRSSPEVIRLVMMLYLRHPRWLADVKRLLAARGIVLSYDTLCHWGNRFGPMFAAEGERPIGDTRAHSNDTWRLGEMGVKINGKPRHLWRALGDGGEVLEFFVTENREMSAAVRLMTHLMEHRHTAEPGRPEPGRPPRPSYPQGEAPRTV